MSLRVVTYARLPPAWSLTLYPDAGELGGSLQSPRRSPSTYVPGTPAADPERAGVEAGRRARAKVRRYCAANRLNRLGTLTYRQGCHDPRQVRRDAGVFFRELRTQLGGKAFPYLWVPEWHKTHGLHIHYGVGRYVARSHILTAWSKVPDAGFVHIKLIGDLPVGSGSLAEARTTAWYLGKYVTKDFGDRAEQGLNRYDCAEGFQPRAIRLRASTVNDGMRQACQHMGSEPESFWSSGEVEDWDGPPLISARWS